MPRLFPPVGRVRPSFAAAMAEFTAEGRGAPTDHSVIGSYLRDHPWEWAAADAFEGFCADIRAQALEATPRPDWWVPATELWWLDGDEFLGRIGIRHRLTRTLLEVGGHVGYDVRPSARRRGHATEMLRASLGVAHELGIDPALITCDADNVASKTVIERNGGVFDDEREGKLRYWVSTGRRVDR